MSSAPHGYQRLKGSARRRSPSVEFLGVADPRETFTVTIVLRRRPDGAPIPNHDFFLNTPPHHRQRMPESEFAALYGASDEDIARITHFVTTHHLSVVQTHAARRTVIASGIVSSMETCFGVKLGHFERQIARHPNEPETETYRGYHGSIHIPNDLVGIVVGVFGLDNRTIAVRNRVVHDCADDAKDGFEPLTVPQVTKLYSFPGWPGCAYRQTIAIVSHGGYKTGDIEKYFEDLDLPAPTIKNVCVNKENEDGLSAKDRMETTMDICIAGSAAVGAAVAVYFSYGDSQSWLNLIKRVIFPHRDDPFCSILSSSYHLYAGDDDQDSDGDNWMDALDSSYQDAAIQAITVCHSSGDYGSWSRINDDKAHVHFPGSDPWVLTVGGTAISNSNDSDNSYTETVWNQGTGATGGGISAYFPLPNYQICADVPPSLNGSSQTGRGVPDVAANADSRSGYWIPLLEADDETYKCHKAAGTSAAAPLWAGLIAQINGLLEMQVGLINRPPIRGWSVGFINPALYRLGPSAFNNIDGSVPPTDNQIDGKVAGYPAQSGWDGCTGLGSINGAALLYGLEQIFDKKCWIQPFVICANRWSMLPDPFSFKAAFSVKVNGFRPDDFDVENVPPVQSASNPVITITSESGLPPSIIELTLEKLVVQDKSLPPTPQIFTWVYTMQFTSMTPEGLHLLATVTTLKGYSACGRAPIILC